MTDLDGQGLLALWNGIDESRRHEYETWHAREHVPERLTVPGMIGARRYLRTGGPLPEYLTLYAMQDLTVLDSAPYRRLLDHPTAWSRRMRPAFRGVIRLGCRRVMTRGGGLGGLLATMIVKDDTALTDPALQATLANLPRSPGVTAVHLLRRDPAVGAVPFVLGGDSPDATPAGVILIEAGHPMLLDEGLARLSDALQAIAPGAVDSLTTYALALALSASGLDRLTPFGPGDYRAP